MASQIALLGQCFSEAPTRLDTQACRLKKIVVVQFMNELLQMISLSHYQFEFPPALSFSVGAL